MSITIHDLLARWDSGDGRPYKGSLIDWSAYEASPDSLGCMCAQGQVLHAVGGWGPRRLRDTEPSEADRVVASLLGISRAHAILLRNVNDSIDGAPSIVLTEPEKVLGDQAHSILAFWRRLDRMTDEQWVAARAAAGGAAGVAARAAWVAAGDAAGDAAWAAWDAARAAWVAAGDAAWAAWDAAGVAARAAAWDAAGVAARAAAWDAVAGDAAWDAAWDAAGAAARDAAGDAASYAVAEIVGAKVLRERGQPFFFLPMFGFAEPEALPALPADYGLAA